jgi:hypothetical protein
MFQRHAQVGLRLLIVIGTLANVRVSDAGTAWWIGGENGSRHEGAGGPDPSSTVEEFSPTVADRYYPAFENKQRTELRQQLRRQENRREQLLGQPLAVVDGEQGPIPVYEHNHDDWGAFVVLPPRAEPILIRKAVGDIRRPARLSIAYPPRFVESLLASNKDILGQKVLSADGDPSFEKCAAFLPDIEGYTFLSVEDSAEHVCVDADGRLGAISEVWGNSTRISRVDFDPRDHVPPCTPTATKRGVLGGWLPTVDYAWWDREKRIGWEQVSFATRRMASGRGIDVWTYLKVVRGGERIEHKYFRSRDGETTAVNSERFFAALLKLHRHWQALMAQAMEVRVPEARLVDTARASLARAMITYTGPAPRYGAGHYGKSMHATFPPTTISMVTACLAWNLLGQSRKYLDYYLTNVVRDDGTFDYYGPAVSEYGQLLDVIANYVQRSGDQEWLRSQADKIERIATYLLRLREQSLASQPADDIRHGLLKGSPEADTRDQVDYYFAGSLWTVRGWRQLGQVYQQAKDPELRGRAARWLAAARDLDRDVARSIRQSVISTDRGDFVPPNAGFDRPFDSMTQDRHASYTNYRYWIEMLSSAQLQPQWEGAIVKYRRAHGGELLGTTRFEKWLDDWPFAGYAYALLRRDEVRPYLLGLYGDLAMHRMRGTFTAYEQSLIDGPAGRLYRADYCVPAQLVAPLLARWMLVFEEPEADVLWLARATPRRWLAAGSTGIAVRRATTRWGLVDYAIEPRADGRMKIDIKLAGENPPAEIRLRVRRPGRATLRHVTVEGQASVQWLPPTQCVRIRELEGDQLKLETW